MESTPQGYKRTKIGIIPNNWNVVKLKEIARLNPGQHLLSSDYNHDGLGITYLTGPSDLNLEDKSLQKFTTTPQSVCKKDDILITIKGSGCGSLFIADNEYCLGRQLMAISPKKYNTFLLYFLLEMNMNIINSFTCGLIPQLTKKDLSEILIVDIPIEEQNEIADIIMQYNNRIIMQEELIKLKKIHKKGLMQKLLTGEVRFSEFSDDWSSGKLGKLCTIKKGTQLNKLELTEEGDYPAINGGIEPSGYTDDWNTEKNTITISEGGNSCGYINFITSKFWSGGHCYSLLDLKINKMFLYQYLKLSEMKIMKLRVGSGLPNIQKKDIENFKVSIPSSDEQDKIAEVLGFADEEIYLLKNELQEIREQKKRLMQKLLTGEVRVNV